MDGAEESEDDRPGAEGFDYTSMQPARRGIAHPTGLWVFASRRVMSL